MRNLQNSRMRVKGKNGRVTPYGFGCGYIERRDRSGMVPVGAHFDGEAYLTLRQCGEGYSVTASGRYLRATIYAGRKLTEARKAFDGYPLEAEHSKAAAKYFAAVAHDRWHDLGSGLDVQFREDNEGRKTMILRDPHGNRQYLNADEFQRLSTLLRRADPQVEG